MLSGKAKETATTLSKKATTGKGCRLRKRTQGIYETPQSEQRHFNEEKVFG